MERPSRTRSPAPGRDRGDGVKLAKALSGHFTIINYDRRGRGSSGDTAPFSVAREVDDLEAMIDSLGTPAAIFGSSSGAALALDAAARLGSKVSRLALFEPPFIVDSSRAPISPDFERRVADHLTAGRRNDVVRLLFREAMGIPGWGVFLMRWLMPGWGKMAAMAPTLPYDLAALRGTQDGRPLPAARWNRIAVPVRIYTGGKSEPFFHSGAKALAAQLPNAEHRALGGLHHGSAVMASKGLVDELTSFLRP
jgi:pimeloyl-ACP methyl ester carboxylesterase